MEPDVLLSKCITLLYRESQIENLTENSADLVRTTVEKIKLTEMQVGLPQRTDTTVALKKLVLDMCQNPATTDYESVELLQQIRIITNGDANLYQAISQGIEPELQPAVLKRTVTNIRKTIANQFRDFRTEEIVAKAYRDLTYKRHTIGNLDEYIRNLMLELEVTSTKATAKDSAIIGSMNFSDDDSMQEVFSSVQASNADGLVYMTGWQELNAALQGGPRAGDTVVVGALQHDYKTAGSLSMFAHMAIYNAPKNKDPNKKPLLYRVSFEDPLRNNAQFLYQLLKYDETRQPVDIKGLDLEEMWKYVQRRMRASGFHVLMEEVNPSNWTYQSMINRIIELESEGYVVEVLQCDYLSKLPTTGCAQGSLGDDVMDLLARIRAFCAAHGILFITPHQLSTEAKRLLQTTPSEQFLHVIKGGGFFEKTKGLDRIYDIGILFHKVDRGNEAFLHMVIDKHRFPTIVSPEMKSAYLRFPSNGMPIPSNIGEVGYKINRKLPRPSSTAEDSFFN